MRRIRVLTVAVIALAGCRPDSPIVLAPNQPPADPFHAGLEFNKAGEQFIPVGGGRVTVWTDGITFAPPSYIDLYVDMSEFVDWDRPEAVIRVKASCPTIGGARQSFDKEYRQSDLTRYDQNTRRALIVIGQVVGTDRQHQSANRPGKHLLTVTIESANQSPPLTVTVSIEVINPRL